MEGVVLGRDIARATNGIPVHGMWCCSCGRVAMLRSSKQREGRGAGYLVILCMLPLVRVVSLSTTGRVRQAGRDAVDANGRYMYMQDLRETNEMVPATRLSLPQSITEVASPLRWEAWAQELSCHPDQEYATFVVGRIQNGFRIGYDYGMHSYKSCSGNMASARQHPEPIRKYLASEMSEGCIIGTVDGDSIGTKLQISRFGVIPKPHQPGKWRLITDLSSPEGSSINNRIALRLCSLSHT